MNALDKCELEFFRVCLDSRRFDSSFHMFIFFFSLELYNLCKVFTNFFLIFGENVSCQSQMVNKSTVQSTNNIAIIQFGKNHQHY